MRGIGLRSGSESVENSSRHGLASPFGFGASDFESDIESYSDVQRELDRSGHNLTSVMSNPRETVFDMLVDALDLDQVRACC